MSGLWTGIDLGLIDSTWLANQVFVRGTVVLAVAVVVAALLRRSSAAGRYAVWTLAVCALVVGPALSLRPVEVSRSGRAAAAVVQPSAAAVPAEPAGSISAHPVPQITAHAPHRLPTFPEQWVWLWAAGVVVILLRIQADVLRAERLRRGGVAPDGYVRTVFEEVKAEVCRDRSVVLAAHPSVAVPLVVGGRSPTVLIPSSAAHWPAERLRSAFRHELAHVVRHDYAFHLLSGVAFALYWPTPLTWLARRQLEREREHACDDRVLYWGTAPCDYATHLVEVARDARDRRWGAAAALAGKSGVGERVGSVLARGSRRPWSSRAWVGGVVLTVLVSLSVSGFRLLQSPQEARRAEALELLSSRDADQRRHGAWMLGELESLQDVGLLETALGDPAPSVRAVVAWALGEIKGPSSVPALRDALTDESPIVREVAALSLGEVGDPTAVQALVAAVEQESTLSGPVAWALSEIGGGALVRSHGVIDADSPLPIAELWSGTMEEEPEAESSPEALLADLGSTDAGTRRRAALALGRLGSGGAVDALLDLLGDPSPGVRAAAVWALDEINPSR